MPPASPQPKAREYKSHRPVLVRCRGQPGPLRPPPLNRGRTPRSTVREKQLDRSGPDPLQVIFALNVAHAINCCVALGLLHSGDHVVACVR